MMKIINQKLVHNWQKGWAWFSNWIFGLICYIATFGLPQEVLNLFPEATQSRIISILALLGILMRFVNQTNNIKVVVKN